MHCVMLSMSETSPYYYQFEGDSLPVDRQVRLSSE
jgi:hypothetical protein